MCEGLRVPCPTCPVRGLYGGLLLACSWKGGSGQVNCAGVYSPALLRNTVSLGPSSAQRIRFEPRKAPSGVLQSAVVEGVYGLSAALPRHKPPPAGQDFFAIRIPRENHLSRISWESIVVYVRQVTETKRDASPPC